MKFRSPNERFPERRPIEMRALLEELRAVSALLAAGGIVSTHEQRLPAFRGSDRIREGPPGPICMEKMDPGLNAAPYELSGLGRDGIERRDVTECTHCINDGAEDGIAKGQIGIELFGVRYSTGIEVRKEDGKEADVEC
ncbi:hypothetical protein B0H16DRAFT_1449637 [Mycena metata]|uniref:Uncharacterized protein n=1 Tax=Mycena metata TaxID=1033252 RepID=A0AAD7K3V5_9AGAR|nr:hypothetical protein B0H16DRAFT_1449637 [Mycena metata]